MDIYACTPYFKEIIQRTDKQKRKILFRTACQVLAPKLQAVDPKKFCTEIGVAEDYVPLFHKYVKQTVDRFH